MEFETEELEPDQIRFDVDEVKRAADGRWPSIISSIAGVDIAVLDGGHHPCPMCDGQDRFNLSREGSGSAYCNQCQPGTGDGITTIRWLTGREFADVLEQVANAVNVKPISEKPQRKHDVFRPIPWRDEWVVEWCRNRSPITLASVKALVARIGFYRGRDKVLAIPVYGPKLDAADPVNWIISRIDGGKLQIFRGRKGSELVSKVTMPKGSSGIVGVPAQLKQDTATFWKTEGPTDALALLSASGFPADGHAVFTTPFGAKEKPAEGILDLMKGKTINVVHDADKPGQEGAMWIGGKRRRSPGWCPRLALVADQVRNIKLPFPLEPSSGKDLRDYIAAGATWEDLQGLAREAVIVEPESYDADLVDRDDDDPVRLANVIIQRCRESGIELVCWRDRIFRWKNGVYTMQAPFDVRNKSIQTINRELELCWSESHSRDDSPVRKTTAGLVKDVIAALKSATYVTSESGMPCWLPDRSRPNYVCCTNGIVDLDAIAAGKPRDCWLIDHTHQWFSTIKLSYAFDPDAGCPKFDQAIELATEGDSEKSTILQEFFGYCLLTGNLHQRFLVLQGEGGTGKSSVLAALQAMVGEQNVASVPLEEFDDRFALFLTLGKIVNIAADVDRINKVAEGKLKSFTSNDLLKFEQKNRDPIVSPATAKLVMAWNEAPVMRDRSDGLWRRMILVEFNRRIPASERVRGMDTAFWWETQGEVPGILNWAIAGMRRLIKQGEFSSCQASIDAVDELRISSDPEGDFLLEYTTQCASGVVNSQRAFELYKHWAKETGHPFPMSIRRFGRAVARVYPSRVARQAKDRKSKDYFGLTWTADQIFGMPVDPDSYPTSF